MRLFKYTPKPGEVVAAQWDGTLAGAREIIDWVCRIAGNTPNSRAKLGTAVIGVNTPSSREAAYVEIREPKALRIIENDFVVLFQDDSFRVYEPDDFRRAFDIVRDE